MDYSTPSSSSSPMSSSSSSPTSSSQPSFPRTPTTPSTPAPAPGSTSPRTRLGLGNKGFENGINPARRVMTSALMNAKLSLSTLNGPGISRRLSLPVGRGRGLGENSGHSTLPGCNPQSLAIRLSEHQEEEGDGDGSYELYADAYRAYRDAHLSREGAARPVAPTRDHNASPVPTQKSSSSNPFTKLRRSVSAAVRGPSAMSIPILPTIPAVPATPRLRTPPKSPRAPISPRIPVPPSPQHTPQSNRRDQSPKPQYPSNEYQSQYPDGYHVPRRYYRPQKNEARCLQRIKEDLYIAFEDDDVSFGIPSQPPPSLYSSTKSDPRPKSMRLSRPDADEEGLRTSNNQRFTHIIRVSALKLVEGQPLPSPGIRYESNTTIDAYTDAKEHKINRLVLTVYPYYHSSYEYRMNLLAMEPELEAICHEQAGQSRVKSRFPVLEGLTPEQTRMYYEASAQEMDDSDDGVTRLTMKQLSVARDFLAGSGYDVTQEIRNMKDPGSASRESPRILITAPRDHRTDVISILVCFLAYVSNNPATELLARIDKQKEFLSVWRGAVGREGAQVVQQGVRFRIGSIRT
ncbi:hypothetical protein VKT23_000295 [Stygiomarasmius scandens]|uniref:Uncharacterized protein n=1 Tax=Marasmiellus scandens TaxID=2682957 RepID=A0ABR1K944_9AGAR